MAQTEKRKIRNLLRATYELNYENLRDYLNKFWGQDLFFLMIIYVVNNYYFVKRENYSDVGAFIFFMQTYY